MAYKAEIAVDVKGLKSVRTLESSLNKISGKINAINKLSVGNSKAARIEKQVLNTKAAQADMMSKTRRVGDLVQKQADKGLKVGLAQEAVSKSALLNSKKEFTESKRLLKVALDELKIQKAISKEIGQQAALKGKAGGSLAGGPFVSTGVASSRFGSVGQPGSPRFIASRAGAIQGPADPPFAPGMFPSSPIGGSKFMFGSPAQQAFSGGPFSSIRGSKTTFGSPAFFDAGARAGGASSPILGSKTTFGSPKFFEASAKAGGPSIPIKGSKDIFGSPAYYDAANKEALRIAKSNAMPIEGFKNLVGSPAYYKDQAKKLKDSPRSSALNFDKRTGKLLTGPAGSGGGGFRNLARRFDRSSELISGGFPLLFGQGPLTAAAGALGGGIGGMFGQMGGFAGGIAATAAVTSIQNVINGIGELGTAMNRLNPNISAMSQAMGIAGTVEEKRLQLIEQNQGKQAAFNAALEMMGEKIGADKAEELRKFGETFQKLGNEVTLFFTKVQAAIAKLLNQTLGDSEDRSVQRRATKMLQQNPNNPVFRGINKQIADLEAQRGPGGGGRGKNKELNDQIKALQRQKRTIAETIILEKDKDKLRVQTNKLITAGLGDLEKENDLNKAIIAGKEDEFLIQDAIKSKAEEMGLVFKDLESGQQQRIKDAVTMNKELKDQAQIAKEIQDAFENLAKSIQGDIKEGIKGLIKGTSTLADLLNNVADRFLDVALNQALFGNAAGNSVTGGLFKMLGFKAAGGPVSGGNPYVVGEKGPELFVPKSSGTIVPNNKLGGGDTNNIVVNVDASGSNAQGDQGQAKQLGSLIAAAVQSEIAQQQRPGGLLFS